MVDQNTFMETVKSVSEIIKVAESPMSEREILAYFKDMELTAEQEKSVLEYLSAPEEEENFEAEQGKAAGNGEEPGEGSEKSPVFRMYLEELKGIPRYGRMEELEMYQALLQGDESAVHKISDCWLRRVLEVAEGYMAPKLNIEDLVQEGNMALFLTLKQLCGSGKCDDVEGVLKMAVEEGIMNYASEMNSTREAEEAVLAKISLVHAARNLLKEENGAEPTTEQIAEYTKMSLEELADLSDLLEKAQNESV
ncbi:MAG: hypothetical protein NC347_09940 [Clostridium sp.]|nr:hypothetical protein [Clostridium sp.]